MDKRALGEGGPEVGAIGLGCMGMSWAYGGAGHDDAQSTAVIRRALERGANLIDTAEVYGPFTNEELVGRALAGRRDEAAVATKCGLTVFNRRPGTFAWTRAPPQMAIAWVLAQGEHVIPIPGTKRLDRLEENLAAAGLRLDAEDMAELEQLPLPADDRY